MKISDLKWTSTLLITFTIGTILLGLTDLFHTVTGVQRYLFASDVLMISSIGWPWYIPVQMGLITVIVAALWTHFFNRVAGRILTISRIDDVQPLGRLIIPVSLTMIVAGFIAGKTSLGYEYAMSVYLVLYITSLIFVTFTFSRGYILAFIIIGAAGPMTEWFLLSPSVGYYEFVQKDLFGRVPGWQLFVYGWGGIFFHYITGGIRRYVEEDLSN